MAVSSEVEIRDERGRGPTYKIVPAFASGVRKHQKTSVKRIGMS